MGVSVTTMGWLRASVGVALVVAPSVPLRLSGREQPAASAVVLMRTIGIRDLVLGLGTVAAGRGGGDDARRWASAGLASDALDTVVSLASAPAIGGRDAGAAAALAALFALGDLVGLRQPAI